MHARRRLASGARRRNEAAHRDQHRYQPENRHFIVSLAACPGTDGSLNLQHVD
jgi:hypothetical protein